MAAVALDPLASYLRYSDRVSGAQRRIRKLRHCLRTQIVHLPGLASGKAKVLFFWKRGQVCERTESQHHVDEWKSIRVSRSCPYAYTRTAIDHLVKRNHRVQGRPIDVSHYALFIWRCQNAHALVNWGVTRARGFWCVYFSHFLDSMVIPRPLLLSKS